MDQSPENMQSYGYGHCPANTYNDDDNTTTVQNEATEMQEEAEENTIQESFFLDNIIVGYAFGPKKMETMGLIMAEASKALSTFECAGSLASMINREKKGNNTLPIQQQSRMMQSPQNNTNNMDFCEDSSMATMTTGATPMLTRSSLQGFGGESNDDIEKGSMRAMYFTDGEEDDTRSMSSTYTRASLFSQRSQKGAGSGGGVGGNNNGTNAIQLTFMPDSSGFIHLVRTDEGESVTGSSVTTSGTTLSSYKHNNRHGASSASCLSLSSSMSRELGDNPNLGLESTTTLGKKRQSSQLMSRRGIGTAGCNSSVQRHPIRVSFVPIDLDTPLEEQHGGKFDVILHKMTEDILAMSKMLRARGQSSEDFTEGRVDILEMGGLDPVSPKDPDLFGTSSSMTRHQTRASRRIQRLREYKECLHPSCVLVDSPTNILNVMSRADMAEVLTRCLAGVTTRGGIPVRTPRFRVVDEETNLEQWSSLADEISSSGFEYPLIAKPLTAAGTKSSHHMGIVLARDGLQRLKTPCLLQEYTNHGGKLFKVYVLGDSVWVFSRESLPNLPMGEKTLIDNAQPNNKEGKACGEGGCQSSPRKRPRTESYVEFERPAGSRCYVEFNSQRPYPKLSDFGLSGAGQVSMRTNAVVSCSPSNKKQRIDFQAVGSSDSQKHDQCGPPRKSSTDQQNSELARFVTKDEIEPVTTALREAFGLELFGFDVLVKHNQNNPANSSEREILVVDVNYFPGYKEVPNFPSLLAQYLTQRAVESRLRNFDGS